MNNQTPLELWKERLQDLLKAEAIVSSPAMKFELKKQLEEARHKIQELKSDGDEFRRTSALQLPTMWRTFCTVSILILIGLTMLASMYRLFGADALFVAFVITITGLLLVFYFLTRVPHGISSTHFHIFRQLLQTEGRSDSRAAEGLLELIQRDRVYISNLAEGVVGGEYVLTRPFLSASE